MAATTDLARAQQHPASAEPGGAQRSYHTWQDEPQGDGPLARITDTVIRIVETPKPPRAWYIALGISLVWVGLLLVSLSKLFWTGIGIWGNMNPVGWGWDIVNFVFWVGIGHAGTLISAILFLLRQSWRTAINRAAEAMTIFAVICALIFPLTHIGRPWLPYWMVPIPNQMGMWPQFRSPLDWDVFAVTTYFTVSLTFWFMGLVPDLAAIRDRAHTRGRRIVYGLLALGWRGSARQWHRYERAYLILAALSTPLVLSVHSVVSFDFATAQLPGWHATIFPPYFVAGAIFSGFAMVVTLLIPARELFGLKNVIELRHLEQMTKIILATSTMVGYAYAMELFIAWYSASPYEHFTFINRTLGPYAWAYWAMVTCNVVLPQLFWLREVRTHLGVMLVICVLVNIGMWFERFVIIATSLARDFLPAAWGYFVPTFWDFSTFLGTFGLFFTLFLLFCRYLPIVAVAEVKASHPAHTAADEAPGRAQGVGRGVHSRVEPTEGEMMNEKMDPGAFMAEVGARAAELMARDRWSRPQLERYRQERLQALLAHAARSSPYYRELLRGRRPEQVALAELPALSKSTLMAEFDRIVTTPELRLSDVEAHAQGPSAGQPMSSRYRVFASSGTSGGRALIVQDHAEFTLWVASVLRVFARVGIRPDLRFISIGAAHPLHLTRQVAGVLRRPGVPELNVRMPLSELTAALQAYQPEALASYAGILGLLAQEQLRGRLNIAPRAVLSTAEVLTAATSQLVQEAWGISPGNVYASTEAPCIACNVPPDPALYIYDDLHIVEVVDEAGQPTPPGTPGARVLITNLHSWTQPLIRYELGDALLCASFDEQGPLPFQRILSVGGRSDDILELPARAGGRVAVHPYVLRSPFADLPGVMEYQLLLSEAGLEVCLVLRSDAAPDTPVQARAALHAALEGVGAVPPPIATVSVPALRREGTGAKAKLVRLLSAEART